MTTKKKATSKPSFTNKRNPVLDPKAAPKVETGVSASADVVKREAPRTGGVQPTPVKHVRSDVFGCSACGQDHTRVLFILRDGWATMEYPYAAKCPVSGKEILMKVGD